MLQISETNKKRLEFAVVLILVAASGNPVFSFRGEHRPALVMVTVLFSTLFVLQRAARFTLRLVLVSFIFISILLMQSVSLSYFSAITVAGFIVRFYNGYLGVRLVRRFPRIYLNVMYYIGLVSLCFYIPDQLCWLINVDFRAMFEPVRQFLGTEPHFNILVYSFTLGFTPYRNSGCFWEPGAFAGYLLVALAFLGMEKNKLGLRFYRSRLFVLSLCLLTTFSTTGYALFPFCLLLQTDITRLLTPRKIPLLAGMVIALLLVSVAIFHLEFVGDKIQHQYYQSTMGRGEWETTRFGTFIADIRYIKRRPILGWGLPDATRYRLDGGGILKSRGNGLTDFICKFGFVGLAAYIICVWYGLFRLTQFNRVQATLGLLVILLALNGEMFLNHPLFLGFMFIEDRYIRRKKAALCCTSNKPLILSRRPCS
jgi:hypothetical protein